MLRTCDHLEMWSSTWIVSGKHDMLCRKVSSLAIPYYTIYYEGETRAHNMEEHRARHRVTGTLSCGVHRQKQTHPGNGPHLLSPNMEAGVLPHPVFS